MIIGIVGLGLIGGSLAKATKKNTNYKVYGFDISETTVKSALKEKSINKELTSENLNECDYVFIPLYPEAVKDYLVKNINNKLITVSYGLLFGGIFGNLFDRILRCYVIDYISMNI